MDYPTPDPAAPPDANVGVNPINLLGWYYLATGAWAIVHLRSFMALTGPKHDTWLVQTFGALVMAIGAALVADRQDDAAARAGALDIRRRLALGSALALSASEIAFVARRRIRPIYLLDAVFELTVAFAILDRRRAR